MEKTMKRLVNAYLRKCGRCLRIPLIAAILSFIFAKKAEDDSFILSSDFEELRRFLNLPPLTAIDTLYERPANSLFFNTSLLCARTTLFILSEANQRAKEPSPAVVFYPTFLDGVPLLLQLPNDPRALNMLCHRFVGAVGVCKG